MKRGLLAVSLFLALLGNGFCETLPAEQKKEEEVVTRTPKDHMPRNYFKEADDSKFDQIVQGLSREKVRELCGGKKYGQFETLRNGRFAFGVDDYPAGVLSLPGHIRLDQEIDFFVSKEKKKAIVVFFKEEKADGILVFDFSAGRWENRSNQSSETMSPAVPPAAAQPARQP